jgi:carboxylesterase
LTTTNFPVLNGADSFFFKGNDVGILVSHGFAGTPQSMRYVGEKLAANGFTVLGVRLKGHGTHHEDLEQCQYEDWIHSLEEGYKKLSQHCRAIYIVGQSMGGTLALTLASKQLPINGVITINAAFQIPCYDEYKTISSPRWINEGKPDIKDPNVHEIVYEKVPLASIKELLSLTEYAKTRLSSVRCPALLLQSVEDHVVPYPNANFIYEHINSKMKTIIPLLNSYHVASMDFDKDAIVSHCVSFIQKQHQTRLSS